MNARLLLAAALALPFGFALPATAGEPPLALPPQPAEDPWEFSLSLPLWLTSADGKTGLGGVIADIDLGPDDIIPKIDMAAAFRTELRKGRFGLQTDFLYTSLSDGVGTGGLVSKVDFRMDQYLADVSASWRILEGDRGWIDLLVGCRYTNLYEAVNLHPDSAAIDSAGTNIVDGVADRINEAINGSGFAESLKGLVDRELGSVGKSIGADRPPLPVAPVHPASRNAPGGGNPYLNQAVTKVLSKRRGQMETALGNLSSAKKAEREAAAGAARQQAAAARKSAQKKVDRVKAKVASEISRELESKLDSEAAFSRYWFDPYVGMRARYGLTDRCYLAARGDIGGFGAGSDLMWQASAGLGYEITSDVSLELAYRALSLDYDHDGFVYDLIQHGAEISLRIEF